MYPGSFDPMTLGHMDILERASKLFDRVIVGIGKHPTKRGWFDPQERRDLIAQSIQHLPTVDVEVFSHLVIDFCKEVGAKFIVRGLRAHGDFESEFQMALANRDLEPSIETVFMLPRPNQMVVSSSLVWLTPRSSRMSRLVGSAAWAFTMAAMACLSSSFSACTVPSIRHDSVTLISFSMADSKASAASERRPLL